MEQSPCFANLLAVVPPAGQAAAAIEPLFLRESARSRSPAVPAKETRRQREQKALPGQAPPHPSRSRQNLGRLMAAIYYWREIRAGSIDVVTTAKNYRR